MAGDLDGDGDDDVVAADEIALREGGDPEIHAMVALDDDSGAFTAAGTPFRVAYPDVDAPALVDFTGDGAVDLVVGRNTFPVLGTGGFVELLELEARP